MIVLTSSQYIPRLEGRLQGTELPLNESSPPNEPSQPTSERRASREDDDRAVLTPVSRDISSVQSLALIHQSLTQRARDDGPHASPHREQAEDDIRIGILVFSLEFANDAAPACGVRSCCEAVYETEDEQRSDGRCEAEDNEDGYAGEETLTE